MSSIVTLVIVLLVIALFCLVFIFFHNKGNRHRTNALQQRLKKAALDHHLDISHTEETNHSILGLDAGNNKLIICQSKDERIINLSVLKHCRKQKKWLHLPAEKGARAETHLEKISLLFEFNDATPPDEFVFYEYKSNSIFQQHELEQKTDYWELVLNRQITLR